MAKKVHEASETGSSQQFYTRATKEIDIEDETLHRKEEAFSKEK